MKVGVTNCVKKFKEFILNLTFFLRGKCVYLAKKLFAPRLFPK